MIKPDYEMDLLPDYEMAYIPAVIKPEQVGHVTPTYEAQQVFPEPGCVFSEVDVEAIPEPTESATFTENGKYNVARIGEAVVEVPQGVFPSGTKQISITANGTTTHDMTNYADAEITVNTDPAKGLVFENYDSDGYPTTARLVGMTEIPNTYCYNLFYNSNILKKSEVLIWREFKQLGQQHSPERTF